MSGEATFWLIVGVTLGALLVIAVVPGIQYRYLLAVCVLLACAAVMYYGGAGWFWTGAPAVGAVLVVMAKIYNIRARLRSTETG
jgi:hypothetical protein